jgi:hypothetical protein
MTANRIRGGVRAEVLATGDVAALKPVPNSLAQTVVCADE